MGKQKVIHDFVKRGFAVLLVLGLLLAPVRSVHAAFSGVSNRVVYGGATLDPQTESFVGSINSVDLSGSDQRTLRTTAERFLTSPRFSADGRKMIFNEFNTESGSGSLFIANADGSNATKLLMTVSPPGEGPVDISDMSALGSFHPDGQKIVFNVNGYILTANSDGSGAEILLTAENSCNYAPVYSPDGSKIAFYHGDSQTLTGSIYTMNADGTNVSELLPLPGTRSGCGDGMPSVIFGTGIDGNPSTTLDWSPDGSRIVFASFSDDGETRTATIKTVDGDGITALVREQSYESAAYQGTFLTNPQYTPEGDVLYKRIDYDDIAHTFAIKLYITKVDGSSQQLVHSEEADGDSAEFLIYSVLTPTIAPMSSTSAANQSDLQNPQDNKPVSVQTPHGTTITCSSATKESTQTKQDDSYQYPLGLVNFCFNTENQKNEVSLTFVTDLKPSDVKARKYNSTNQTYFDIQDASITETIVDGQHALKLTYTITDNGPLDLNPENGKITDPVGLATNGGLADTGQNQLPFYILATLLTLPAVMYIVRRKVSR